VVPRPSTRRRSGSTATGGVDGVPLPHRLRDWPTGRRCVRDKRGGSPSRHTDEACDRAAGCTQQRVREDRAAIHRPSPLPRQRARSPCSLHHEQDRNANPQRTPPGVTAHTRVAPGRRRGLFGAQHGRTLRAYKAHHPRRAGVARYRRRAADVGSGATVTRALLRDGPRRRPRRARRGRHPDSAARSRRAREGSRQRMGRAHRASVSSRGRAIRHRRIRTPRLPHQSRDRIGDHCRLRPGCCETQGSVAARGLSPRRSARGDPRA